jgi:hypothetical protein
MGGGEPDVGRSTLRDNSMTILDQFEKGGRVAFLFLFLEFLGFMGFVGFSF